MYPDMFAKFPHPIDHLKGQKCYISIIIFIDQSIDYALFLQFTTATFARNFGFLRKTLWLDRSVIVRKILH